MDLSFSGFHGWPDLNHSVVVQSILAKSGCALYMPGSMFFTRSPNFMSGGTGTQNGAQNILWSSQPM